MKRYLSLSVITMFLFVFQAVGQNETTEKEVQTSFSEETVMVYGECGMCKSRIEKALKELDGITSAIWSIETKILTVSYDKEKLSLDDIEKKVVSVGHDTDRFRADDEVYNALPGCCKYERPKS